MYHLIWDRSQTWAELVGHGGSGIVPIKLGRFLMMKRPELR